MVAAVIRVPTSLGYIVGGYAVGPSSPLFTYVSLTSPHPSDRRRDAHHTHCCACEQKLQHADAVHTVAMLGPMFDLFCLGIMYASLRSSGEAPRSQDSH